MVSRRGQPIASAERLVIKNHAACYTLSATGPASAHAIERFAATAAGAEIQMHALKRLCGKLSVIAIWGPNGRAVTADRLYTLARSERPD